MESHYGPLSRGKQCLMKTIPAAAWRVEARRGGGEASQSPALDSSHGNGNEDQRKQCRGRTGRRWRGLEWVFGRDSQWEPVPGRCATGNGDVGRGWPFEWRRGRNTGSFLKKCFSLNIFRYWEDGPGEIFLKNHWRHNQDAGILSQRKTNIT